MISKNSVTDTKHYKCAGGDLKQFNNRKYCIELYMGTSVLQVC